jgi:hypothetical protein
MTGSLAAPQRLPRHMRRPPESGIAPGKDLHAGKRCETHVPTSCRALIVEVKRQYARDRENPTGKEVE